MARGIGLGLLAAALFGASIPLTKLLAADADPLVLAGLLYLGAGAALAVVRLVRRGVEAKLRASDAPWLAGIVACGAVAGPILLVIGLRRLPGVPAALLLNLEAPLTAVLAVALFGEHLSRRGWAATALLAAGAAALAAAPGALRLDGAGAVALVRFKGLAGGGCTLLLGLALGGRLPGARALAAALGIGALGYGASIVWHVQAMRVLGAARQSALFATAPFAGALLSVPLLGERFTAREWAAAALMAAGVALLAREQHGHLHVHEPVEHEHLHVHDEHHRHEHSGPVAEPHSHAHQHDRVEHAHPHASDLHHRHKH